MEKWHFFIIYEIDFLLNLPRFVRDINKQIQSLENEIMFPIMKNDEALGMTIGCPTTEEQAMYLINKRQSLIDSLNRATKRGKRLVRAINQLEPHDKAILFENDGSIDNPEFNDTCSKLYGVYKVERTTEIKLSKQNKKRRLLKRIV